MEWGFKVIFIIFLLSFKTPSSVYTIKTHKNSAIKFDICNDIPDANCTDFSSNVYDAKNCIHYSSTSKSDKYWKFVNGI